MTTRHSANLVHQDARKRVACIWRRKRLRTESEFFTAPPLRTLRKTPIITS